MQKSVFFTAVVFMVLLLVMATNFFTNQTTAVSDSTLSNVDAGTNARVVVYDA